MRIVPVLWQEMLAKVSVSNISADRILQAGHSHSNVSDKSFCTDGSG